MVKETNERKIESLLMVPYANLDNFSSGVNIKNKNDRISIYLKNCCIACISAKEHMNEPYDIALVTNIEIPEPYYSLLKKNDIIVLNLPFNMFNFGPKYRWSLAFYKLCALYYASHNLSYNYIAYIDNDVYVQSGLDEIWKECKDKILLYDLNEGLKFDEYIHFLNEIHIFDENKKYITHFGGEFFCASKENACIFSEKCDEVFQNMRKRNYYTSHGDEFILSIVADSMKDIIKNGGAYISRYWTGNFRLVSTNYKYNPVTFLHVPAEKETGMLRLYNYYCLYHKMPFNKKVWKILHLNHKSIFLSFKKFIRDTLQ